MALAGRTGIAKSLTARPLWAPDRCRAIYRKGASQDIRAMLAYAFAEARRGHHWYVSVGIFKWLVAGIGEPASYD